MKRILRRRAREEILRYLYTDGRFLLVFLTICQWWPTYRGCIWENTRTTAISDTDDFPDTPRRFVTKRDERGREGGEEGGRGGGQRVTGGGIVLSTRELCKKGLLSLSFFLAPFSARPCPLCPPVPPPLFLSSFLAIYICVPIYPRLSPPLFVTICLFAFEERKRRGRGGDVRFIV